jgi:hypothetical protein
LRIAAIGFYLFDGCHLDVLTASRFGFGFGFRFRTRVS